MLCALALWAEPAGATVNEVFSSTSSPVPCFAESNGVRFCSDTPRSTVKTFDGVPLDVNVALPARAHGGPEGPYPLVMLFHGYGGAKAGLTGMQTWLEHGYATLSVTARGFGESCGTAAARAADPQGCAAGYVRLADTRHEVRDAQELAGLLVDERLVLPQQIGAVGGSYGGAIALSLAALRDRKMLPDGSLVPWTSPAGVPMRIAAAAPRLAWSDLSAALMPNGGTLDYVADAPYAGPTGVRKQSWEDWLFEVGRSAYYAPEGADPDADIWNWHVLMAAGEPYDDAAGVPLPAIADMRAEIAAHHSPYYVDHSNPPAPVLLSSGWTDDLFPADEAIRFFNRTRTEHPDAVVALFLMDFGHQRGQGKAADRAVLGARELEWFDHYLYASGPAPPAGVEALTQTCPGGAPSDGPFSAPSPAALSPGEVAFGLVESRIVFEWGGSPAIADAFDPIAGGGACVKTAGDDQPGVASYRAAPAPAGGFNLMGSPTVLADIASPVAGSEIAARLLDVDPAGEQTLIARGLWRPVTAEAPVRQVFQLHPNAWRFAEGHVAKLELLSKDTPYAQTSNAQADITVSNLEVRLPVRESPGALGGRVREPAPKVLPPGGRLARDYWPAPYARPKGATPLIVSLVPSFSRCTAPNEMHGPPLAYGSCTPKLASRQLSVGTTDANGAEARFTGTARLSVAPGDPATATDDADVRFDMDVSDVRVKQDLTDYAGELRANLHGRLTDRLGSASAPGEPQTLQDSSFPVTVPCAATVDANVGADCAVSTSFDAIVPGAVAENRRSIWQLSQIDVFDGGGDGLADTTPNSLFARQGLFVP